MTIMMMAMIEELRNMTEEENKNVIGASSIYISADKEKLLNLKICGFLTEVMC